jgi:enoyl-CoA hydratase
MGGYETIGYQVSEGLATITLSRPEKRNAIDRPMFQELGEATARAGEDADVRAVLVRGAGPSFCAGIDVAELAHLAGAASDDVRTLATAAQRPMLTLATMGKPTVAAIHGHALGAGLQLALACDLRIAADDALLGVLEIRFGLIPDLGGTKRLPDLVGPAAAKDLIWSGRQVEASEAVTLGLVNKTVPRDRLEDAASDVARTLAAAPPGALALVKRLVDGAPHRELEEHLAEEREAQVACVGTEDHREAVAAYLEQREPKFAGR